MTALATAEVVRLAILCSLLGSSLELGGLLGLGSGSPGGGRDPGTGGLLGTGLLGRGGLLGGILGGGSGDGGKGRGLLGGVLGGIGGLLNNTTNSVLPGGSLPGGGDGGVLGGVLGGGGGEGGAGLLGGVLGGGSGDGGKGTGLLGGVLGGVGGLLNNTTNSVLPGGSLPGGGDGGVLGGILGGGGGEGGAGLLGGVLGGGSGDGGKGKGLLGGVLGGVGGLLNNTTNSVLPGGSLLGGGGLLNGVLDQNSLGDLLGGEKGLLGLPGILNENLLGLGNGKPKEPFQWYNVLNLKFIRGSWKILQGTELVLNLQATIVMNLPGPLFLSGVSVDVNITAHLAITQDRPGDLKLVLKNCQNLVAGFTIKLPPRLVSFTHLGMEMFGASAGKTGWAVSWTEICLITLLINGALNNALRSTLPAVICPMFQIWINLINVHLQALNNYAFFGLLGKIHTALSSMPISTGQFSELDLKDNPFPGAFLKWLLNYADSKGNQKFPGDAPASHLLG